MIGIRHLRFLFLLVFISGGQLLGQVFEYGNDWYTSRIDQPFIKMALDREGIYRVNRSELESLGYDLSGSSPTNIKVFYRGNEIPLFVHTSPSGEWARFEFYGQRNDGFLDARMYRNPTFGTWEADLQPDADVSLFSDQSAYFLTWDESPGLRYANFSQNDYANYSAEPHFRFRGKREFHPDSTNITRVTFQTAGASTYSANYSLNSDYGPGEGYMFLGAYSPGVPRVTTVYTPAAANLANPSLLRVRSYGISSGIHDLKVELNSNTEAPVIDTSGIQGVFIKTFTRAISSELSTTNELKFIATYSDASSANTNRICWADIIYDRLPDLLGKESLPIYSWEKTSPAYFSLSNIRGDDSVFVFDFQNRTRSAGILSGAGELKQGQVILASGSGSRPLYISSDAGMLSPSIEVNQLRDLSRIQGAEFVIIANRNHQNSAEAYVQYRDTASVNPLSAMVVYTDEIFDQFGYGSITPWAIKRFCKYALDTWDVKPQYFLLWGKGHSSTRGTQENLVPTYGYPATDHEFISHYDPNSRELNPEAAIGRVNIYNDEEGFKYLNKVKEYEYTSWQTWMKKGVFLGGGADENEQNFIGTGLQNGVDNFEGGFYGGDPTYFQKRSGETVLDPSAAGFHDIISNGSLFVHFFGHSAVNIQDVDIRNANEYSNFGKFPLIVAMGCYGGNFTGGRSFGESWVIQEDRGAIGYLANSNVGIISNLRNYSNFFYESWFEDLPPGSAIGDVVENTILKSTAANRDTRSINHARQMNLQGDPAIKLYYPRFPDLSIRDNSIYFPEVYTAKDDSFQLNIIIENSALVRDDSFWVEITQQLPDGSSIDFPPLKMNLPPNQDTLSIWLPNTSKEKAIGQNTFTVQLDARNDIEEYSEQNNQASLEVAVPGNVATPLFPTKLSVYGENELELLASAFFAEDPTEVGYIFEIDTSALFNSPLLENSGPIKGNPFYKSWTPSIPLIDSVVYFWRVRLSEVDPSIWQQSSFTYIPQNSGWAQAHPFQFSGIQSENIQLDLASERWKFDPQAILIGFSVRSNGLIRYQVNSAIVFDAAINAFGRNALIYNVYDQNTVESVYGDTFLGGGLHSADMPSELHKVKIAIQNTRPGDYFLLGTNRNPFVDTWDEEMFALLKEIGVSDNIRLLDNGDPFILFGRKGFPNSAIEIYQPNNGGEFNLEQLLYTRKDSGRIWGPVVGPVKNWKSMFWDWNSLDLSPQESIQIILQGLDPEVRDSVVSVSQSTQKVDLSGVDPERFPFMRLSAQLVDSVQKTAPQLTGWYLIHDPLPDLSVDPVTTYEFAADSLNQGDSLNWKLAVRNLTPYPTDSFWVYLRIERSDRSRVIADSLFLPGMAPSSSTDIQFSIQTAGLVMAGSSKLILEINPQRGLLEQYYFNNSFEQAFFVEGDATNPILDVTVDGRHIIDGDIVNPRPEIVIEIDDENSFLAIQDSSAFELYFGNSAIASNLERIFASDARIEWIPASLPENKAQIRFSPGLEFALADDTYTLRVQARDPAGNLASTDGQYLELSFEVVNDRTLTQVLNYPNPFSSSTRFVYTLTGEELPELFQIQIFTLSGKQVKVIDLVELGEIRWGRHITDYAWDGTDEYGDPLGNGVYLYRTVVKFPSGFTLRTEGTEQYFKSGWGKMYLMR